MSVKQIGAYQKSEILTAEPMQLVLMCYDAAIKNLKLAKVKYQEGDIEPKSKAIQKAVDLLGELMVGLDFEKGGHVAKNLDALYRYMIRRITVADVKKDVSGFDEVIDILGELEGAWRQVAGGKKDTFDTRPLDGNPKRQSGAWVV